MPNLALLGVLTDRKDLIRTCFKRGTSAEKKKERKERKKALIPGCGRWCDVILLASSKYDAYNSSKSVIRLSSLCVQDQTDEWRHVFSRSRTNLSGMGLLHFLKGGFFHDEWILKIPRCPGGKLDLINNGMRP